MEYWQLKQKQSLSLESKIIMTKDRIREYYEKLDGKVYVSFSGGKDSTVLLDIVRSIYPDVKAVFSDTGLEYPEIRDFVKTKDNVVWVKPKLNFKTVIEKYGYPVVSKKVARSIKEIRYSTEHTRNIRLHGNKKGTFQKLANKWMFLINAPFEISSDCCRKMKKEPLKKYEKDSGTHPIVGVMASDSKMREGNYLAHGCNSFIKKPMSMPLSFWLESDIWEYIKTRNIPYSSIYDMGYIRTGCMFCMFGVHLEKYPNRFILMRETHPKQYKYCMEQLGLQRVLEYLNVDGFKESLF